MDPPKKFHFNLNFDRFWWKLKITSLVFCLNSTIAVSLIMAAYYLLDQMTIALIVEDLSDYKLFFTELNRSNFYNVLYKYCVKTPITEEFIYRYPIILLPKNKLSLKIFGFDLTRKLILFTLLILNIAWSATHIGPSLSWINLYHLIPIIPITLVGLTLYWLAIKTRVLWPNIVCHAALNLSLYFLVQGMIYFEFKPVVDVLQYFNQIHGPK